MQDTEPAKVDLIQELRLRRWARRHYVPPEEREDTWHPIVLQEMRRKDAELQQQSPQPIDGSRYVPLAPTEKPSIMPDGQQTAFRAESSIDRGPHFARPAQRRLPVPGQLPE